MNAQDQDPTPLVDRDPIFRIAADDGNWRLIRDRKLSKKHRARWHARLRELNTALCTHQLSNAGLFRCLKLVTNLYVFPDPSKIKHLLELDFCLRVLYCAESHLKRDALTHEIVFKMVNQYERTGDYQFPDGEYQEHERAATRELEGWSILGGEPPDATGETQT